MNSFLLIVLVGVIFDFSTAKCTCDSSIEIDIPNLPKIGNDFLTKLFGETSAGIRGTIEGLINKFKNATVSDKASLDGFLSDLHLFLEAISKGTVKSFGDLSNLFSRILGYLYSALNFGGKLSADGDLSADLKGNLDTILKSLGPYIEGILHAGDILKIPVCNCENKSGKGGFLGGLIGS